jgi:hypothetical protein
MIAMFSFLETHWINPFIPLMTCVAALSMAPRPPDASPLELLFASKAMW